MRFRSNISNTLILILFLNISAAHSAKLNYQNCAIALSNGVEVSAPYSLEVPPNTKVFKLGHGMAGGTVYRLISPNEPSKVLKIYYSSLSTSSKDIEPNLRVDLARMSTLQKITEKNKPKSKFHFKVAETHLFSNSTMEIEDIHGTPLDQVLDDSQIHSSLKEHLLEKYRRCLQNLFKQFQKEYPESSMRSDGFLRLDQTRNMSSHFFIKLDNIIVTANLDLVIVDPY